MNLPSLSRSEASSFRLPAALAAATAGLLLAGCHSALTDPDAPQNAPSHAFTGTAGDKIGDDYVYYPAYEVYYSPARKEYVYYNGSTWVRSVDAAPAWATEIRSARSVPMNFHDSPAGHHQDVLRMYPRNWQPPEAVVPGDAARTTNDDVREGRKTN